MEMDEIVISFICLFNDARIKFLLTAGSASKEVISLHKINGRCRRPKIDEVFRFAGAWSYRTWTEIIFL